jgi:hypothetical protein
MRLRLLMFGLAIPVLIATGQERPVIVRGEIPSGAVRSASAPQRGAVVATGSELSALSQLIGITPDQLSSEYLADNQLCAVPLRPYISLRLAENRYHFDRATVLRQMCARRTTSFAFALQSAGGTYGTLTAPGPKQNQELRDAEREYLREIGVALKARPYGK